jgi:hypothetical protein
MQLSFSWFALFEINPFLLVFQSLTLCVYMFQLASVFMWEDRSTFLCWGHLPNQITRFLVAPTTTSEARQITSFWKKKDLTDMLQELVSKKTIWTRHNMYSCLRFVWCSKTGLLALKWSILTCNCFYLLVLFSALSSLLSVLFYVRKKECEAWTCVRWLRLIVHELSKHGFSPRALSTILYIHGWVTKHCILLTVWFVMI